MVLTHIAWVTLLHLSAWYPTTFKLRRGIVGSRFFFFNEAFCYEPTQNHILLQAMYKLLFFNLRLLINTFLLLGLPILGINHAKAAITATQDLSSDTFSSNPSLNDGTTNFTCEDKISTNKYDKLVSFYETFISSPLLNDSKIHNTCKDKGFTKK